MRYSLLIALLLLFLSCEKSDPPPLPTDGSYEGMVVYFQEYRFDGQSGLLLEDTFFIELVLEGETFRKPGVAEATCEGKMTFNEDQIRFSSNDCDCFCGCDTEGYCAGDLILGQYNYRLTADSLLLWLREQTIQVMEDPGINIENERREDFFLRRVD